MLRLFFGKGKQDEESGERVLLQHDIVIMYSILFVFIIILKCNFYVVWHVSMYVWDCFLYT